MANPPGPERKNRRAILEDTEALLAVIDGYLDTSGDSMVTPSAQIARSYPPVATGGPPVSGYLAWYDATQITGVPDNTGITSWSDSSGNGNNLTGSESTGGRGVYHSTGVNLIGGKPIVFQTGQQNHSSNLVSNVFTITAPMSIAAVLTGPGSSTWSCSLLTDDVHQYPSFGFTTTSIPSLYDGLGNWTFGSVLTGAHSLIWVFNGASTVCYVDGVSNSPTGSGTPTNVNIVNGINIAAPQGANGYLGSLGEIIVYNSALSSTNASALHTYFVGKWSVP